MEVVDDDYDACLDQARRQLARAAETGALERASAACSRAIALRPDAADAWLVKCQVASAQDDDAGALAAVEMALARAPGCAEAHFWRAAVLGDLGLFADGLDAIERALALVGDGDAWLLEDLYFEKAAMLDALGATASSDVPASPPAARPRPALRVLRGGAR